MLALESGGTITVKWWLDAAFAVHQNMLKFTPEVLCPWEGELCSIPGSLYTARVAPYQSMIGLGPLNKARQTRHSLGLV